MEAGNNDTSLYRSKHSATELFGRQSDKQIIQNDIAFRSLDLNRCVFWLWDNLNSRIYQSDISKLATSKHRIVHRVSTIRAHELHSAVKSVVHCMQFLEQGDEAHLNHIYNDIMMQHVIAIKLLHVNL